MDTNILFTAEECVDLINDQLQQKGLANDFTTRLLRHYAGEGVVPKALRDGKFARYNAQHVAAVVALRSQQQLGLSSKAFKTYSQTSTQPSASGALDRSPVATSVFQASSGSALNALQPSGFAGSMSDLLHGKTEPLFAAALQSTPAVSNVERTIASLQSLVESSVRTEVQESISDTSSLVSTETLNQRARALVTLRGTTPLESLSPSASLDAKALIQPMASAPLTRSLKKSVSPKWVDVDCGAGIRLQIQEDRASSWTENDTQQLANAINLWKDSL